MFVMKPAAVMCYPRVITIITLFSLALITYSCNRNDQCTSHFHSRSYHSHRSHSSGGGACVWSKAKIHMADNTTLPINEVKQGYAVWSMSKAILVTNKICHDDGPFTLWDFGSKVPIVVTENHPVYINGSWYAGNPEDAFNNFGITCKRHGSPSAYKVDRVCSLELEGDKVSMYNANGLWVAD